MLNQCSYAFNITAAVSGSRLMVSVCKLRQVNQLCLIWRFSDALRLVCMVCSLYVSVVTDKLFQVTDCRCTVCPFLRSHYCKTLSCNISYCSQFPWQCHLFSLRFQLLFWTSLMWAVLHVLLTYKLLTVDWCHSVSFWCYNASCNFVQYTFHAECSVAACLCNSNYYPVSLLPMWAEYSSLVWACWT